MNKHDQDNLRFIMSLNDEQFNDWAMESTDDDIKYAMELLQRARLEQDMLAVALWDQVEDLAEANAVLKKFRL